MIIFSFIFFYMYKKIYLLYYIYIKNMYNNTCIYIYNTNICNKYMYSNTIINQVQIQINFKCNNLTN